MMTRVLNSVLTPRGGSRFYSEDGRTGGPRGFCWFEMGEDFRNLRRLRSLTCGSKPKNSHLAQLPSSRPPCKKMARGASAIRDDSTNRNDPEESGSPRARAN